MYSHVYEFVRFPHFPIVISELPAWVILSSWPEMFEGLCPPLCKLGDLFHDF